MVWLPKKLIQIQKTTTSKFLKINLVAMADSDTGISPAGGVVRISTMLFRRTRQRLTGAGRIG